MLRNTIYIAGPMTKIEDYTCGDATIKPGSLVEQYVDSGVKKWRKHSSATNMPTRFVALEKLAKGVDDDYELDDLMLVGEFHGGGKFWGYTVSGQDITYAEYLQSNGDGAVKAATSIAAGDNVAAYQSEEAPGAVTVLTRLIVRMVG